MRDSSSLSSNDSQSLLKSVLQNCVKNNFAGVENVRLYSQTYFGTKKIVENYIDEGKIFLIKKTFLIYIYICYTYFLYAIFFYNFSDGIA